MSEVKCSFDINFSCPFLSFGSLSVVFLFKFYSEPEFVQVAPMPK